MTIEELITGVNIALGMVQLESCPAFADELGEVTMSQLMQAVIAAEVGCPELPALRRTRNGAQGG